MDGEYQRFNFKGLDYSFYFHPVETNAKWELCYVGDANGRLRPDEKRDSPAWAAINRWRNPERWGLAGIAGPAKWI